MARTTQELVGGIIEVEDGDDLTPFIFTANELVTEACAPLGYTEARLELIERWLSAHFYAVFRPPSNKGVRVDVIDDRVDSKVDLGFNVTWYGQQALRIDTLGGLASIDQLKTRSSLHYLGTPRTQSFMP